MYPCKYDRICSTYNPKNLECTHRGGGCCEKWTQYTDYELYASDERPPMRDNKRLGLL